MKTAYFLSTLLVSGLLVAGCRESTAIVAVVQPGLPYKEGTKEAVAYFAGGCFWHTEVTFQGLAGVRDAVSGYAARAETVAVYYDSAVVSYPALVDAFFTSIDPTQVNGQGNDIGRLYRSVAFYRNAAEKNSIEQAINRLTDSKKYTKPIATEVTPFTSFEEAEDTHQEYVLHHPNTIYVYNIVMPAYRKFRNQFPGKFKE